MTYAVLYPSEAAARAALDKWAVGRRADWTVSIKDTPRQLPRCLVQPCQKQAVGNGAQLLSLSAEARGPFGRPGEGWKGMASSSWVVAWEEEK